MTERKQRNKLYQSARWRDERSKFLRSRPVCLRCGKKATVVDHIDGHGPGWESRFWDRSRWQPLCWPCHSSKTVTEDDIQNARGLHGWRQRLRVGGDSSKTGDASQAHSRAFDAPREADKTKTDPRTTAAILLLTKLKGIERA